MLGGRPVIEWTLAAFENHPGVDSITIAAGNSEIERLRETAVRFSKVTDVVVGGATRAESVRNGLSAIPPTSELVLVHDAARPLVSAEVIGRVIEATARIGAAVPGLPLSDTVKRADANGIVRATLPRSITKNGETLSGLTAVQTPQGARVSLLRQAYARFDFAHSEPTDEASLIENLGEPVQIVAGDPRNLKITRQEDLQIAEVLGDVLPAGDARLWVLGEDAIDNSLPRTESSLINTAVSAQRPTPGVPRREDITQRLFPETRTGLGYDVHAFADVEAGRRLFLGGIEIPHDRGLEGHSDADVLLHAVCDALLGAASLGDIGILFPNTDETYKGIASLKLLEVVAQRLREAGWQIVNIDATVVAEAPKLMPHRIQMQETMAQCLQIEPDRVSVKATTSEKLGFIGRREGMEATAIATVRR